jgi:hypothetical protein
MDYTEKLEREEEEDAQRRTHNMRSHFVLSSLCVVARLVRWLCTLSNSEGLSLSNSGGGGVCPNVIYP